MLQAIPPKPGDAVFALSPLSDGLRARSRREPYPSAKVRKDRLSRLIGLLAANKVALCDAIRADYGARSPTQSLIAEIFVTMQTLRHARANVGRWMRPEGRSTKFLGLPLSLIGARAEVFHQPLGVVGVIGPWNFPVNLLLSPLAGIFAAGNVAFLKPSEHTPATAALLDELIRKQFGGDELAVALGDVSVARAFSALPFDHLIYTGGEGAARHILHACADNLTPVTLELGGKSPVVISRGASIKSAATRIIGGKLLNNGQVCLSPDYLLIPREKLQDMAKALTDAASEMVPAASQNPDVAAVVNPSHFARIRDVLGDAAGRAVPVLAGADAAAPDGERRMPLTVVVDPPRDSRIMREEIFGPLMALKPYDSFSEATNFINAMPRPLALYYFGSNEDEIKELKTQTVSGSLVVNDVIMQYTIEDLPFGGVGPSGMGRYHGYDGFKTFSNARAVYRQAWPDTSAMVRPPFVPWKARLFDFLTRS